MDLDKIKNNAKERGSHRKKYLLHGLHKQVPTYVLCWKIFVLQFLELVFQTFSVF